VPGVSATDFQGPSPRLRLVGSRAELAITYQLAGVTNAQPGRDDGLSTLGFLTGRISIVCSPRRAFWSTT